jgi:hypothetical protein
MHSVVAQTPVVHSPVVAGIALRPGRGQLDKQKPMNSTRVLGQLSPVNVTAPETEDYLSRSLWKDLSTTRVFGVVERRTVECTDRHNTKL